jgi:hypothetical protein
MPDFTLKTYTILIEALLKNGFHFLRYNDFQSNHKGQKIIILRHDVDLRSENSLQFAKLQYKKGIAGTYYFRVVPQSFDEKIMKEIYALGHEVGYHYEDVSLIAKKNKCKRFNWQGSTISEVELVKLAIENFKKNLEIMRQIVPVDTICMHGSPMSRWDSRVLWKYYNYRDFGIIGEPYFDINFNEVFYLTDTGRRWDGGSVSVRDKTFPERSIVSKEMDEEKNPVRVLKLHSSFDIIRAAEKGDLPDKLMMTFHPQRWSNSAGPWIQELVWQNVKNSVKYFLVKQTS